jgi:hypothetical protein
MSYSISTLLTRNLNDVFGENDPVRRRAAIDQISMTISSSHASLLDLRSDKPAKKSACDLRLTYRAVLMCLV